MDWTSESLSALLDVPRTFIVIASHFPFGRDRRDPCVHPKLLQKAHGLVIVQQRFYTIEKVSESILSLIAGLGRVLVGLFVCLFIHPFICLCVCVYLLLCTICIYTHTAIGNPCIQHTYVFHIYIYIYIYIYIHIYIYTYVYIYIYTHIYIYIYYR